MAWQDEMTQFIQLHGKNVDARLLEGKITSVAPLRFQPDIGAGEMNARFAESVADGAAIGQAVLAIQDMTTRRCYVIARLV